MKKVNQLVTTGLILSSLILVGCDDNYKTAVKAFSKMTGTKITDSSAPKKGHYSTCVETLFNKMEKSTGAGLELQHIFNVFKDHVVEVKIDTTVRADITTETKDIVKLLEVGQAPDFDYIETVDYQPYLFNAYREKSLGSTFNDGKTLTSTTNYDRSSKVLTIKLEMAKTTKNLLFHGVYNDDQFAQISKVEDLNGKGVVHSKNYPDGDTSCSTIDLKATLDLIQNN